MKPLSVPHLEPSVPLLCKLGSIIVHADEITERGGLDAHPFDIDALRTLLADPEVRTWISGMGAMLPLKRSAKPTNGKGRFMICGACCNPDNCIKHKNCHNKRANPDDV